MKRSSLDTSREKNNLRKKLRSSLSSLAAGARKKKSKKIEQLVLKSKIFQEAENILFYSAMREEVGTQSMIRKALALNKTIYLPRVKASKKQIEIYEVRNLKKDLLKGYQGILEPRALKSRKVRSSSVDLVIVPGLGFTRRGKRLGRGGGYYDRLLKRTKNAYKLGLAFKEQIVRNLSISEHDVCMDRVITD